MFQFTREFIINDLNGKLKAKSNEHISSTLFGTNNKGRFAITEYKKNSSTVKKELMIDNFINIDASTIRSFNRTTGAAAKNEVLALTDLTTAMTTAFGNNTIKEGDYVRLNIVLGQEGRVISTYNDYYADHSNNIFVEAKVGSDTANTLKALVANCEKADKFMNNRLVQVVYEGTDLVIKAEDEFTRVKSVKVVKINVDDSEKIGYGNETVIFEKSRSEFNFSGSSVKGDLGAGTTNILVRNNRLETSANYDPYGTNKDERPVPGGIYDQFVIEVVTNRNQIGHQVFGSVGDKSLTTIVIFALKDAVANCLNECLEEITKSEVSTSSVDEAGEGQ